MPWPCVRLPKATVRLALDWMKGDVSNGEVRLKMGGISTNIAVYRMAVALRQAYGDGLITVKERSK